MRCAILLAALAVLVAVVTAAPQEKPRLTGEAKATHERFPGGHRESFKVTQDGWVSRDGNLRAGGYVQHDRDKFGGQRTRVTHGGLSISGRF